MKKRLYTVLLSLVITAGSFVAATPASDIVTEGLWGIYVRNTATAIRDLNEGMNALILSMKYAVFVYEQYVNPSDGLEQTTTYLGQTVYLKLTRGDFYVETGLANTKSFDYLFTIQEDNALGDYLLKFYFNDLTDMNAVYGISPASDGALVVADTGSVNPALAGIQLEIYCYGYSGSPAMNFSVVRNQTVAIPVVGNVTYETTARARFVNYAAEPSPYFTAEIYYYTDLSGAIAHTGYHTLAYRIKNEAGYYTTVQTGCGSSGGLSNNGKLYHADTDHNFALFKATLGAAFVGDGYDDSAIPPEYPTAAQLGTLYGAMTADYATLFNPGGDITTLSIDPGSSDYDTSP